MAVVASIRSNHTVAVQERTGVVVLRFRANGTTAGFLPLEWGEGKNNHIELN